MRSTYAAVDLGNSSARVIVGILTENRIDIRVKGRVPNAPVRREDGWHWNHDPLWSYILSSLNYLSREFKLRGIAIDSWGVDYGLLDQHGKLIGEPYSYRDDRTLPMVEFAAARMVPECLYALTGCQAWPINTLYQLLADQQAGRLDEATRFQMIPDIFASWLTGVAGADETIASTTQLFDPVARDWCWEAIDAMQLPRRLFAPVRRTGMILGEILPDFPSLAGIPVITAAGHDTAAAFVAATGGPDQLVISIGTWSLVGVELASPLITDAGREANFTNEAGVLGTIRFLRNAMGLWLIQELQREWQDSDESFDWETMVDLAEASPAFTSLFNPDLPLFMEPGPIADRIVAAGDAPLDGSFGSIVRSVFESLAMNHRWLLGTVEQVTGRELNRIRMVGGGSQNRLMCQMTADATGLPVIAGPAEATAIGNVAMQAIATGQISDLDAARHLIDRSFPTKRYEPNPDRLQWDVAYARWQAIASR